MGIVQKLYQLQQIEQQIESDEKALSGCLERLGESDVVNGIKSRIQATRQQLEEIEKKQHSAEWQIDDIEAKLAEVKDKLYSGRVKNPKELGNLQQEENSLQAQRQQLEDDDLEMMEQAEAVTADLAALESELEAAEKEWQSQQKELSSEIEKLKESISGLQEKQKLVLADIDAKTIDYYNQLKKKKGWAVSKIEQGTCCSCRITLSTAELQRVRGRRIIECSSCRRILFLE